MTYSSDYYSNDSSDYYSNDSSNYYSSNPSNYYSSDPSDYDSSQDPENKKRNYKSICSLYSITHLILSFFAIYLSWKCNNGKFDLLAFLTAFFCPYLYIIWALATRGGCGVFEENLSMKSMQM